MGGEGIVVQDRADESMVPWRGGCDVEGRLRRWWEKQLRQYDDIVGVVTFTWPCGQRMVDVLYWSHMI
jgi:hypothetical protein